MDVAATERTELVHVVPMGWSGCLESARCRTGLCYNEWVDSMVLALGCVVLANMDVERMAEGILFGCAETVHCFGCTEATGWMAWVGRVHVLGCLDLMSRIVLEHTDVSECVDEWARSDVMQSAHSMEVVRCSQMQG